MIPLETFTQRGAALTSVLCTQEAEAGFKGCGAGEGQGWGAALGHVWAVGQGLGLLWSGALVGV